MNTFVPEDDELFEEIRQIGGFDPWPCAVDRLSDLLFLTVPLRWPSVDNPKLGTVILSLHGGRAPAKVGGATCMDESADRGNRHRRKTECVGNPVHDPMH